MLSNFWRTFSYILFTMEKDQYYLLAFHRPPYILSVSASQDLVSIKMQLFVVTVAYNVEAPWL
jgi:hypothetical protein